MNAMLVHSKIIITGKLNYLAFINLIIFIIKAYVLALLVFCLDSKHSHLCIFVYKHQILKSELS